MFTDEVQRGHQATIGENHTIELRRTVDGGDGAKHVFFRVEQGGLGGGAPSENCYCIPSVCSLNSYYGLGVVAVPKCPGVCDFLQCMPLKNLHCVRQFSSSIGLALLH